MGVTFGLVSGTDVPFCGSTGLQVKFVAIHWPEVNFVNDHTLSADLERLRREGQGALAEVFSAHRERLERMVAFRLDPRIRGRLDPADVLQEAYLEINRRLGDYLENPSVSCFVWMRQQTFQVLVDLQRGHFREKRSPLREVSPGLIRPADATSFAIAHHLISEHTSPSVAVAKLEEIERIHRALAEMNETDREVLALRHFELLTNQQVAEILGLSSTAASNRYVRAAARLGEILAGNDSDSSVEDCND